MINAADTNLSQSDFKEEVQRSALEIHTECFGKETLKARNRLLLISFVLFLVSLGAAAVEAIKPPESTIGLTLTKDARLPLSCLCLFFLIELSARSKTELTVWKLKNEEPIEELLAIQEVLKTTFVEKNSNFMFQIQQSGQKLKEIDEIKKRNEPALGILKNRVTYIQKVVRSAVIILRFRVWWEMMFPIFFGIAALVLVWCLRDHSLQAVAKP